MADLEYALTTHVYTVVYERVAPIRRLDVLNFLKNDFLLNVDPHYGCIQSTFNSFGLVMVIVQVSYYALANQKGNSRSVYGEAVCLHYHRVF